MERFSNNGWEMINNLMVEIPSQKKETLEYGTLKLFTPEKATKHNEFDNRVPYGTVVGCANYRDVNEGDKVWFHHNIVINQTNMMSMAKNKRTISHKYRIDAEKNWYLVKYSETDLSLNCMAYLVEKKDTKEKKALNIFCFGKPIEKEELVKEGSLIVKNQHKRGFALECELQYVSEFSESFGIKKGDKVGVLNNADYKMDVDDESLWRFPYFSVGYVIESNGFKPMNKHVIIKLDKEEESIGSFELAHSARKTSEYATVVRAAEDCDELNDGDRVIHETKGLFNIYEENGEEYYLVSEEYITAVI